VRRPAMLPCMAQQLDGAGRESREPGIDYLTAVSVATATAGAAFVLLPDQAYSIFGWMIYGSGFPGSFGDEEGAYIRLAHNVMGALMAGWFAFIAWFVRSVLPRRIPGSWNALVLAFLLWFILDTTYSVLSGFWQNAVLNLGFLVAFTPGFWLTRSLRSDVRVNAARP
jgi:hypothetical protein